MKNKIELADSEIEIMELLWKEDRAMPSKEILDYFNNNCNKNWKKQTLNTFLFKLLQRGVIRRISEERRYLYIPIVTKKEYEQRKAEHFISRAYDGSFLNFISALSGGEMISEQEAQEIKKILRGE